MATQYDHNVQGSAVLGPLRVVAAFCADATVSRPVSTSDKGAVLSQGLMPRYSDIDTYHMATASLDMAVRAAVAAGCPIDHLAILDNFCWCSSEDAERLGQLKRACEAIYDLAVLYKTPFISGKDSMFNDFKGYDENDKPVKISIPPTLLVSGIGVTPSIEKLPFRWNQKSRVIWSMFLVKRMMSLARPNIMRCMVMSARMCRNRWRGEPRLLQILQQGRGASLDSFCHACWAGWSWRRTR